MTRLILHRLLLMIPTLLGISLVTFLVIQLAPGDPGQAALGAEGLRAGTVSAEVAAQTRQLYGLDQPILYQYGHWLRRFATLDFGRSFRDGRPVRTIIAERLPVTLQLSLLSVTLAYLIAIPLGVWSAQHRGGPVDRGVTVVLFVLYSLPSFWVALLLLHYLGLGGGHGELFPLSGLSSYGAEHWPFHRWLIDRIGHLVLPVTCLTYVSLARLSRYQRTAMLEVLEQDYIRTARAKGLPERVVIWKHALRNALIPLVTLLGSVLPSLVGGSVIVESIFSIPGLGKLGFEAMQYRDYPVIMALTTITAILTMGGILLSDLLYLVVDPRIRLSAQEGR